MVFYMNGYVFYWVAWLVWIIITFFQTHRHIHYIIICWLFSLMITLNYYVTLFQLDISIAFIILLIGAIVFYGQAQLTFQRLITTYTLMITYLSLKIWNVIAPIWFVIPTIIAIPFIISMSAITLSQSTKQRLIHILFSMTCGELFYSFILRSYHLNNQIGSISFFDYLAISIFIIVCVHILHLILLFLKRTSISFYQKALFFKK